MSQNHEPRQEFVERLAATIAEEARRPSSTSWSTRASWFVRSPWPLAAAAVVTISVSMAAGGAVVAASYRWQAAGARSDLTAAYQERLTLARTAAELASAQLAAAEKSVAAGIQARGDLGDPRARVVEARAAVRDAELDLVEIQASGHEPQTTVSAPLVSGRDFVTEHWQNDRAVPAAALQDAQTNLTDAERRVSLGITPASDAEAARAHVVELQTSVQNFARRLAIRQQFLKHDIDAGMADLLVLQADAQRRREALQARVGAAQEIVARMQRLQTVGQIGPIDLAQAQLNLQELQLELTKVNLDLAMIQRQIDQRHGK